MICSSLIYCTESAFHLAHLKSLDYPYHQKKVKNGIFASYIATAVCASLSGFEITKNNYENKAHRPTHQLFFTAFVLACMGTGVLLQDYTSYKLTGKFLEITSYGLISGILSYTAIYPLNETLSPNSDPQTTHNSSIQPQDGTPVPLHSNFGLTPGQSTIRTTRPA